MKTSYRYLVGIPLPIQMWRSGLRNSRGQNTSNTEVDSLLGHPKTSITNENVDNIHRWSTVHRHWSWFDSHYFIWDLWDEQAVCKTGYKNAVTRVQVEMVYISRTLLSRSQAKSMDFYRRLVTQDETVWLSAPE